MAGSTFKEDLNNTCEKLDAGRRTCLCYQVEQLGKGMSKKSHVSWSYGYKTHTEVNITKSSSCYTSIASPKPRKPSKTKYHLQALKGYIKFWVEGNIEGLFYECMTIQ